MNNALKPRERIKTRDINEISDSELLAILLGSGTKGTDVVTMATQLITELNGLRQMSTCSIEEFQTVHGIGEAKACILFALFELTKRISSQKFSIEHKSVTTPKDVYDLCLDMCDYDQEKVVVLCLNLKMELISKVEVFIGELTSVQINPREIFKVVFGKGAYGFILVHNHPSGSPDPSDDDLVSTKEISNAANMLNILFVDHIIVAKNGYYSIREHHRNIISK